MNVGTTAAFDETRNHIHVSLSLISSEILQSHKLFNRYTLGRWNMYPYMITFVVKILICIVSDSTLMSTALLMITVEKD